MITEEQINGNKEEFIRLLKATSNVHKNIDRLIQWLETSDFFEAPSSTVFHNNYKGGLCEHSLNVYRIACKLREVLVSEGKSIDFSEEELIISALLHDLCKTNFYVQDVKVFKDESAPIGHQWKKYNTYKIEDKFPYGHGEKSVFMLQRFIALTGNESLAIRWHMGNSDPSISMSNYTKSAFITALEENQLVNIISLADQFSSFLIEKKEDPKKDFFY